MMWWGIEERRRVRGCGGKRSGVGVEKRRKVDCNWGFDKIGVAMA